MEPTDKQLKALTDTYFSILGSERTIIAIIKQWEDIRPKDEPPTPKLTPDEIDRREFEAVMLDKFPEFCWASDFSQGAFEGWKAARAK